MADVIVPDWPCPPRVRALVTTRAFGNLASHVGEAPSLVLARRQALRALLPGEPLWLDQVHGTACVVAEGAAPGSRADAAVARSTGRVCAVLTADCLPVLLCDDSGTIVAAAHAGWRGLAAGILENTVAAMGVPGDRLLAWLGPAIGPTGFEVGGEVRDAFLAVDGAQAASSFAPGMPGKWQCDLFSLARLRLARAHVTRVYGGRLCTWSDPEHFFSYRREHDTGRMASLIWTV